MNESDYVQVKGRTARQDKDGSYESIIREGLLERLKMNKNSKDYFPDQLKRAWEISDG